MNFARETPAPDRLLTPLGGLVFALTMAVLAFWVPVMMLLLSQTPA